MKVEIANRILFTFNKEKALLRGCEISGNLHFQLWWWDVPVTGSWSRNLGPTAHLMTAALSHTGTRSSKHALRNHPMVIEISGVWLVWQWVSGTCCCHPRIWCFGGKRSRVFVTPGDSTLVIESSSWMSPYSGSTHRAWLPGPAPSQINVSVWSVFSEPHLTSPPALCQMSIECLCKKIKIC